jgi:hypothetical protein
MPSANVNFVGNKYIAGPDSNTDGCWLGSLYTYSKTHIYTQDNETPWCGGAPCPADTFNLGWGAEPAGYAPADEGTFRVYSPFAAPAISATSRSELESVLSNKAGATIPKRDALDARLVSELQSRTGNIGRLGAPFPDLPTVTSAPQDSDHDGMPDSWESSHGLNPNNGSDGAQTATNGYTNLENYLNELAGDGAGSGGPTPVPTPNGILCSTLYPGTIIGQGFGTPWYRMCGVR